MLARRTANKFREWEWHQVVNWRKWSVRLAGQPAVSGQEPGEGEPFGVGEDGLDRGERGGWGGSGHRAPPGRAETQEAGPAPGSQR